MTFYQYLLDRYGSNEPILLAEIQFEKYSKPWIYKELRKMCDNGQLIRYEKGVYYIPTKTVLGISTLNPRKVIEKKYISSAGNTQGYYSGITFLNQIGISTQMPNRIELYTNNENSTVREITIGKQKVLLRRARTTITPENADVQSFLEMMSLVSADFFDEDRKKAVAGFIEEKGITRRAISEYAPVFPDRAMRTMVESGVIYSVTR